MHKLDHLARRMKGRGIAIESLLEGSGISPECIGDPAYMPSATEYRAVVRRVVELSPPGIGITLGLDVSDLTEGLLGYAALYSRTLRDFRNFSRTYKTMVSDFVEYAETMQSGTWALQFTTPYPMDDVLPFLMEEMLARVKAAQQAYTGVEVPFETIELAYPAPPYLELYHDVFRCPIRFDQQQHRVVINEKYLDLPIALTSSNASTLLEAQCVQLLGSTFDPQSLGTKIRRQLILNPGDYPTLAQMSTIMSLSPATLKRRLRAEGETYQGILDSIRKDLAIRFLSQARLSVKEVSYRVGFSNVHNFRRAFKGWTGVNPSHYQAAGLDEQKSRRKSRRVLAESV